MSIFRDRFFRYLKNDAYLPWKCYTTTFIMFSPLQYCSCLLDCKFLKMPTHPS